MGFWSRLWNLVRGPNPQQHMRGIPVGALEGLTLTDDQALNVAAVWACMCAIANPLAGADWNVFQPLGPNRRRFLPEDPLHWLLNTRPNPEMTAIGCREALLMQAVAWGNAYAEIVPDRLGRPVQLWPLLSDRVFPRRDVASGELVFDHYDAEGSLQTLPLSRVFHLHGPSLNGLIGENIISRAARAISLAAAQERYATAFFGRGATPSGFLKTKGKLGKVTVELMKEDFKTKYSGVKGAHQIIALEDGTEFQQSGIEPQKAQLVEEQQFSVEQIARIFGVPLHKIGHLLRATFANVEQQDLSFVRDTLTPWAHRLEQEADAKLVGPRAPRYTAIDLRALTQGDAASRATYNSSGIQNGWMTPNEARAREGLDNVGPDGDQLLVNGTLRPLEQALEPPAPPPAPVLPAPADDVDEDEGDDEEDADQVAAVAREGLALMMRGALERHRRRLDSRGDSPERSRAKLVDELQPVMGYAVHALGRELTADDVARAADLVEQGRPVVEAAQLTAGA